MGDPVSSLYVLPERIHHMGALIPQLGVGEALDERRHAPVAEVEPGQQAQGGFAKPSVTRDLEVVEQLGFDSELKQRLGKEHRKLVTLLLQQALYLVLEGKRAQQQA